MGLSRVNKYRNKRREKFYSAFSPNKTRSRNVVKKLILSSTLAGTALFSTSVAYAQLGVSDHIKNWYLERLTEVEEFLTTSIKTDATNQKANLLRQVREQTELSVRELQEYAANKRATISVNLEEKAKETADIIDSQNQEDLQKAKDDINEQVDKEMEEAAKQQEEKNDQSDSENSSPSAPVEDNEVEPTPSDPTEDTEDDEPAPSDPTEDNEDEPAPSDSATDTENVESPTSEGA